MELEKIEQSTKSSTPFATSKSTYDKIVAENERLMKDYRREVAKTEKLQLTLSTLQIQHEKLTQEVDRFNKSASTTKAPHSFSVTGPRASQLSHVDRGGHKELEVKVEQLQAEVEKKTAMLMEVKQHLKEAAERERELNSLSADAQVS